ncbi:unnamed protein product [Sphagnum troendelagicum]|uniref:Methyltransferase-like protein 1 n=1 Tax=Sphagnum troendelagicum TaxID=128251 RepID=A0ABP0UHU7_9BRYO
MGSPEKEPVKRRKSEGVQSFKDRDWDDEHGGWEKEYKHRPSKSRRSSKSDRDGCSGGSRRDQDRDWVDRVSRAHGDHYEKGEKHAVQSSKDDDKYSKKVEKVERDSGKAERERGERDRGERDRGGRDKGEERSRGERDRGERERGDESSRSDHQRKAREKEKFYERHTEGHGERHSERHDERHFERHDDRARERPESGWGEDSEDVQGRSSGRDRGEQERAAKPSTRDREDDKTQGLSMARDKGDEEKGGGGGPMLRGMQQQGVKGGRGGRGGVKGGRGSGREGQRGGVVPPIMGPGPNIGPHFGPLGPPVPMAGMVPGPGLGPGMGPGGFPMPHFGGPMGWGGGHGGDMGMMGCPPGPGPGLGPGGPGGLGPRFGPGMGPGPGPNMFFNPPAPGRGLGGMPGGMFGGGGVPPFGGSVGIAGVGRGMMGERGPPGGGRGMMGRGSGPPGRGPSRGEQNDYSQHFVDTGLRPQNFIRDVELADRFEEYPKLKELITRKDRLIADRATPPMYMQCDLRTTELQPETFGTKFDVILVDPPWEEYVRRAPGIGDSMEWWSPEDIQNLRIEAIADTPAFIFLWVGDAEGLEQGRLCLKKWGFRRCEDICWVKTNRENPTPALRHDSNTLFQHSKEHCLMGIKGTVRRSSDGHIIHANVDTDIIISEEPEYGSTTKPEELYHIIEHFAQGQRRIELFGEDHNIRAGWVTVGKGLTSSNFNPQIYGKYFTDAEGKVWQGGRGNPPIDAPHLVGTTPEIEALRPKSPPPRPQQPQPSGQGNAGNSLSQPSAGNSNNKKTSTGPVTGGQNGHPTPLVPGAGHGSPNPLGAGPNVIGQPPLVGGRGGGHGQIPKLRQILPVAIPKHLGAGPGIEEFGLDEEASFGGEVQETSTEVEVLTITEPENHPQIDWG